MVHSTTLAVKPSIVRLIDHLMQTAISARQEDPTQEGALHRHHANVVRWESEEGLRKKMHFCKWVFRGT